MTWNTDVLGGCALAAALVTMMLLAAALRYPVRPKVPDWIWEEVSAANLVRVRCRHCNRSAEIIMPVAVEGAMVVRGIFAGQHAACVPGPVTFV